MDSERKQVLQLLAEGKITTDDADRLLDKLNGSPRTAQQPGAAGLAADPAALPEPKFMRIHIDSNEGDLVDVRLPVQMLRSGIKLSAMLPKDAAAAMANSGFDFAQLGALTGNDFFHALREMSVDITAKGGERIKVSCE